MRTRRTTCLSACVAAVALVALGAGGAQAQEARLQLPNLDALAQRASETVDITLDTSLLQLAASFMTGEDADEAAIKELLQGLKGIYVKSYEFDRAGAYSPVDIETVRAQLARGNWTRLINVKSARQQSQSEVYAWMDKGVTGGLAIVAAEPLELTIVNIVGRIDLEKLRRLEGQFGIPKMQIESTKEPKQP